ncbi:hypothetical protein [Capnocytophaga sp.]|uniref:hypothetical protein n=1 Tax=Capnocytophaga sp. TaxID=44737 RepID=UPI0026DC9F16|nr:hypothetical protein [Capnocytophaga sp.]MDO5105930.1 hypothetical protein [Capnocytophaga sp.]
MKETKTEIEQSTERFFAEIPFENWLGNVGKFPTDSHVFSPFLVENVGDAQKVKTSIDSIAWENFDLDNRNALFAFADKHFKNLNTNDLTMVAVQKLNLKKSVLEQKIREKQLPDQVFDFVLLGVVMSAFMEFFMQEQNPKMPIDVSRNLLKILNLGYLPCGWKPQKETSEIAYDPIYFVTDNLQKSALFDYKSGVLLVF